MGRGWESPTGTPWPQGLPHGVLQILPLPSGFTSGSPHKEGSFTLPSAPLGALPGPPALGFPKGWCQLQVLP